MKRLMLIFILTSCYSVTYAQFKISLSYQVDRNKANYSQDAFASSEDFLSSNHHGNTIQANAIWLLTDNFSVYTGVGYSSKYFKPSIRRPTFFTNFFSMNVFLTEYDVHNIEIPVGIKFNFATFKRLSVGVSIESVPAFTIKSIEHYELNDVNGMIGTSTDFETLNNTEWTLYGIRVDASVYIEYAINEKFGLFTSFYWSPFDWRYADRTNDPTNDKPMLLSRTMQLENGQQGIQFGVNRTF